MQTKPREAEYPTYYCFEGEEGQRRKQALLGIIISNGIYRAQREKDLMSRFADEEAWANRSGD